MVRVPAFLRAVGKNIQQPGQRLFLPLFLLELGEEAVRLIDLPGDRPVGMAEAKAGDGFRRR